MSDPNELSEEEERDADSVGREVIVTTIEELRTTLLNAFVLWATYHRGPEGIEEDEMRSVLRRWPNPRWLAVYAKNREWGLEVLLQGAFDPEEDTNE